ncbi:MAG: hypothetical protein MJZ11_12380, partial [Lachnospiraceae bacterium]|nr:hypothetical protein [Lachnospiraceae bacterium]
LDPTSVGWLSVDPLFEKYVGMSPYNYCAGNPVKLVDTDGRENVPALIWAIRNMANKGIISNYNNPYFGGYDNRWIYKIGDIPDRTVCYESCFMAYMNSGKEVVSILRSGFTTNNNAFLGRSTKRGGINWFKNGNNNNLSGRKFEENIAMGQLGDIVFMGESGDMLGHAVLLASDVSLSTIEKNGKSVNIASFYALSTSSDTDPGSYGGRLFTFEQNESGKWLLNNESEYEFRGYGQLTKVKVSEQQRNEVLELISKLQKE